MKRKFWLYWVIMLVLIFSPFGHAQGAPAAGDKGLCQVLLFDSAAFKTSGVFLAFSAATGVAMPGLFAFFAVGAIAFDYWAKQQGC